MAEPLNVRALVLDNDPGNEGIALTVELSPQLLKQLKKNIATGQIPDLDIDFDARNPFGYFLKHRYYAGPFQHVFAYFCPEPRRYSSEPEPKAPMRIKLTPAIPHTLVIACCEETSQMYAIPDTMLLPDWRTLFHQALAIEGRSELREDRHRARVTARRARRESKLKRKKKATKGGRKSKRQQRQADEKQEDKDDDDDDEDSHDEADEKGFKADQEESDADDDEWSNLSIQLRALFDPDDPKNMTPVQQQIRGYSLGADMYELSLSIEGEISEAWVIHLLD